MRYCILVFLILEILLLSACKRSSCVTSYPAIDKWMADNPQSCLKHYIGLHDSLFKAGQYDTLAKNYEELLMAIPVNPVGNSDTLRRQICTLLAYQYEVTRKTGKSEYVIHFLDSIRLAKSSFLSIDGLYPLLAYETRNSLMTNNNERTEQLANLFKELPQPEDASIVMECCHQVSWAYHFCSAEPRADSKMQEMAVEAYKRGGSMKGAGDVLARMGYFYRREGKYEQAVDMLLQAVEWYEKHPDAPLAGKVRTYGDLAALYSTLELYDKAFESNAYAIQLSMSGDSAQLADMLRIRSALHAECKQVDSAFYYLEKELEVVSDRDKAHQDQYRRDRSKYLLDFYPDSVAAALRDFTVLYNDSVGVRPAIHSSHRYWLGRALMRSGRVDSGLALMERAYREFANLEWEEMEEFTGRGLLDAYAKFQKSSRLAELYPRYILVRDSLDNKSKLLYTAAANVRYETKHKEQENLLLVSEVRLKERTLTYFFVVLALLVMLLGFVIFYMLQRRRHYRRESLLHHERLSRLISIHQELNGRYESLNNELEKVAHTDVIDNVRQNLNPMLLSGDDERRFRQSFAALYPHYLPALRRLCPELTKNDELLCMLIMLNQSTDEAALALGISRASVNSGRSRIRKKLGLGKDESLEAYLKNIKK